MGMKTLHIIRGLPASGKSTLGATLGPTFAADDYFTSEGVYKWRAAELPEAHMDCQRRVEAAMLNGDTPICVANTFIKHAHYATYVQFAAMYGYTVEIHDLYDGGLDDKQLCHRNMHSVPLATIEKMRRQYER